MRVAGRWEELKEPVGRIMAALKDKVKGRTRKVFVYGHEIAKTANVSPLLLWNILQSDFITVVLEQKSVTISPRVPHDLLITIPINFGLEILNVEP